MAILSARYAVLITLDKRELLANLQTQLNDSLKLAISAANAARNDATHEQSKAETQYDSLGTEMSYLADGQNQRIVALKSELYELSQYSPIAGQFDQIQLGNLVCLEDSANEKHSYYFILPFCGGSKIETKQADVQIITPQSPLAKLLLGKYLDDEIITTFHTKTHYWITQID